MVEVTSTARISRWLEEASTSTDNSTIASEVLLVRRSLAWITGIILLISTLLGVSRGHSCPFGFSYYHWSLFSVIGKLLDISVPRICTLPALACTRYFLYNNLERLDFVLLQSHNEVANLLIFYTHEDLDDIFIYSFDFNFHMLILLLIEQVCMLMNMPLTRDTLLYSNVKID